MSCTRCCVTAKPVRSATTRRLSVWSGGQNALRADLGNVSRASRTSSLCSGGVGAAFDHLALVVDHPIGRMPDTPDLHLFPTVRTPERIAPGTLCIPLSVGQPSDDLHRALDYALDLGQGRLKHHLDLGKGLRGLHPVIPDALEAFGHRMLHLCGEVNYVARMTQMTILP